MTVTVLAPPAAVTSGGTRPTVEAGPSRRVSTPTALQLLLTALAVLCVLSGALGAVVAARSAGAAHQLTTTTVPAEVDAATVYTSIADADASAATAFLAGGLEPAALRAAYQADIAAAGKALAGIGVPAAGTTAATALADISARLPVYTGLIETARANNRQGFPVGGAYLSTASDIAQTTLLADADTLLGYEQSRVSAGYADARSSGTTALLFIALVGLGLVLILGQLALTRRTHRVLNVPLVLATVLILGALIATAGVVGVARDRLDAGSRASSQIASLTTAQIDALKEKGDESLTLVGRGDDSHEAEFQAAAKALAGSGGLLEQSVDSAASTRDTLLLENAATQQQAYLTDHTAVTRATDDGDFAGSDKAQAAGAIPFGLLVDDLAMVRSDDRVLFNQKVSATTHPLDALAVILPVLCALALLAGAAGIRLRLREFR